MTKPTYIPQTIWDAALKHGFQIITLDAQVMTVTTGEAQRSEPIEDDQRLVAEIYDGHAQSLVWLCGEPMDFTRSVLYAMSAI